VKIGFVGENGDAKPFLKKGSALQKTLKKGMGINKGLSVG